MTMFLGAAKQPNQPNIWIFGYLAARKRHGHVPCQCQCPKIGGCKCPGGNCAFILNHHQLSTTIFIYLNLYLFTHRCKSFESKAISQIIGSLVVSKNTLWHNTQSPCFVNPRVFSILTTNIHEEQCLLSDAGIFINCCSRALDTGWLGALGKHVFMF